MHRPFCVLTLIALCLSLAAPGSTRPAGGNSAADAGEASPRSQETDRHDPPASRPAGAFLTGGVYYAVLLSPGPAWNHRLARDQQPGIAEHRAYMAALLANGTVPIGGPFVDTLGGLAVLRAASLDEARRIINADPAVRSKLLTADVRRWNMSVAPAKP